MGWYTANEMDRLDRVYFVFPPGWHLVESRDQKQQAQILIGRDGQIKELIIVDTN